MLISSLRGLRDAQQRLPLAAAGALSAAWRGLAADAASGDGEQPLPAASSNAAEPGAATDDSHASSSSENFAGTAQIISIDRSTLYNPPLHGHQGGGRLVTAAGGPLVGAAGTAHKEPETDLVRHLKALIQVSVCWLLWQARRAAASSSTWCQCGGTGHTAPRQPQLRPCLVPS